MTRRARKPDTTECKHPSTRSEWRRRDDGSEVEFARFCHGCGVRLGMGYADEPVVDVRAAALVQDHEAIGDALYAATEGQNWGWFDLPDGCRGMSDDYFAGSLARAIVEHDELQGPSKSFVDDQHHKQAAVFDAAAERYEELKVDVIAQFAGVVDHASGVNGTLAGLIEAEISAATEYADAKELAVLEHGYGGKEPLDPERIVGLEPYTPDLGGES